MSVVIKETLLNERPKIVWKFVTLPQNFPKYVYSYISGKTTSPNPVGIGASYVWYGKFGLFRLRSAERIVGWQEQKRVAYTGKLFGVTFDSSITVKEAKRNKTTLTVSIKYKVPFYLGGKIMDYILIK